MVERVHKTYCNCLLELVVKKKIIMELTNTDLSINKTDSIFEAVERWDIIHQGSCIYACVCVHALKCACLGKVCFKRLGIVSK